MIIFLVCFAVVLGVKEASNVIPHLPKFEPKPELQPPLTLKDPIHPGTVVWIMGSFHNTYNNDLKIYVIAGGDGGFNEHLRAVVLEIRAFHDEDKITYGSLSHWGDKWNYAANSKNPVRDGARKNYGYDFVLEFKDNHIVVWVNSQMLSVYPYSATIHDLSEISGIHIPQNAELKIEQGTYLSSNSFGSFPYEAKFDPPLSQKTYEVLISYGLIHCGSYDHRDVEYVFCNKSGSAKDCHFTIGYICRSEEFFIGGEIDGKPVGLQKKKYEASKVKNGIALYVDVGPEVVKVQVNKEELFDFPHQVDIAKYPITDLLIASATGRFSMVILGVVDIAQ